MLRRLCIAMLPLMLAACFQSENPKFPRSDLVQPADLFGRRLNLEKVPHALEYDDMRRGRNGEVLWITDRKGAEATHNQVIPLVGHDSYLFVMNSDQDTVNYAVLERLSVGAWGISSIELSRDTPFAAQNVAYAQAVSARHGLSLKVGDGTTIESPLTATAVLALFRDPEFLGALTMQRTTLLTAPGVRGEPGEELDLDPDVLAPVMVGVDLAQDALAGLSGLARPNGLEGSFLRADPYHEKGLIPTRIQLLGNGKFEVLAEGAKRVLYSLFPFNEAEGEYLAVRDTEYGDEDSPNHALNIAMVARLSNGWVISSVSARPCEARSAIVAMRRNLMERAASRHGLAWNGADLSGVKSIDQLVALFRDGQFTSGLDVDGEHVDRLFSHREVARLLDGA